MTTRSRTHGWLPLSLLGATTFAAAVAGASCAAGDTAPSGTTSTGTGGGTAAASGATTGAGGSGGDIGFQDAGDGPFTDFPALPVVDPALPLEIPALFQDGPGEPTGGPCLTEPAMDAMVPRNWTPLFFEWTPGIEQNVFELRLEVDNQINPLVVYTADTSFTIDAEAWKKFTEHSAGHDIKVTIRGAVLEGGVLLFAPQTGVTGTVHLAPVDAPGSVVYWTSSAGTSFQGFTIGDTKPKKVLSPDMAGPTSTGADTACVSCHASSPDGKYVIYSRDANDGSRAIDVRKVSGGPADADEISPSALALLGRHKQTAPTLSKAHYAKDDAVVLSVYSHPDLNNARYELIWTDLHAADESGWGVLARDGDERNVSSPSWRRDGTAIAYVSSPAGGDGVIADVNVVDSTMDIYTVPYNDRKGGAAAPLPGASDPALREFYPVYSPDDTWLAFNRSSLPVNSYNQASAEVFVVPGSGGAATRLKANDPPACSGFVSPGLTNSWARWAPEAAAAGDRKYYWLIFSSKRRLASSDGPDKLFPQLYISAVVTKVVGGVETLEAEYPAVYVTSQNPLESNHTPAWDAFKVEQIPE